jgi:hypothetical protein
MHKKNLDEVKARLFRLFEGKGRDEIFATTIIPSKALKEYAAVFPQAEMEYPDLHARAQFWDAYQKEGENLEDDSFPQAYMSEFDEGLYAGLLGAKIRFLNNPEWGWVSSMSVPFIEDVKDLKSLSFDTGCSWAEILKKQLLFYADYAKDKFGISHFILIDGLNLLLELRGATNMYYDCLDAEEEVRKFMALARDLNYWVQDTFFDAIGFHDGGTVSNMGQWIPGKIVSESLDPYHMAAPDFFYQWGLKGIEEMFSRYDGGIFHIHSGNGQHLVPLAAKVKGVKMISFIDENWNSFKAYQRLNEIDAERGDVPVGISIPYPVFKEKLEKHELPGNVLYTVTGVDSEKTANSLMKHVKSYRCGIRN